MTINIPRIVVSGVKGKIGKTTITLGIIKGLIKKGYKVQPFKVGPDFIDPSYHTWLAGRDSRNLDSVLFSEKMLLHSFAYGSREADIAVIEGVLGLYDSVDGVTEKGSTAYISKIIRSPVILIMDAERINRGLQAILHGFLSFDRNVNVRGVIINGVRRERQADKIIRGFKERFKNIELVGLIPYNREIEEFMRYRHLGLIHMDERRGQFDILDKVSEYVVNNLDIDRIAEIAKEAEPLDIPDIYMDFEPLDIKVGILKDESFTFYYPENIEFLSKYAMKLFFIDSLHDSNLPDIDLLVIGGGFPEVYAIKLESNKPLMNSIRKRFYNRKLFIYAECGGLMYLTDYIEDLHGDIYHLLGIIEGHISMTKRPVGHGYIYLEAVNENPLGKKGEKIVGHEFHYSNLHLKKKPKYAFKVLRGYGVDGSHDGIMKENLLALYTHLHVYHNPALFHNLMVNVKKVIG
jgi:cobyrinic acid a,c-diamide synthase